jgi:hypothetical protein
MVAHQHDTFPIWNLVPRKDHLCAIDLLEHIRPQRQPLAENQSGKFPAGVHSKSPKYDKHDWTKHDNGDERC